MVLARPFLLATMLTLASVAPAHAAQVSMAGGSVSFSTPSGWLDIMDTDGNPEVRVFQVPDPSPTGQSTLARVTVTVKQAPDLASYRAWMTQASAKAQALPGYAAGKSTPDNLAYTAREAGVASSYRERYFYKDGRGIQLRCVRPQQSGAGAAWIAAFDHGCDALAAQLSR